MQIMLLPTPIHAIIVNVSWISQKVTLWFFIFLKSALHWAAKHGRGDIVKLLAGTHGIDVNGKTVSLFSVFSFSLTSVP